MHSGVSATHNSATRMGTESISTLSYQDLTERLPSAVTPHADADPHVMTEAVTSSATSGRCVQSA
jgi:hypothetical protein